MNSLSLGRRHDHVAFGSSRQRHLLSLPFLNERCGRRARRRNARRSSRAGQSVGSAATVAAPRSRHNPRGGIWRFHAAVRPPGTMGLSRIVPGPRVRYTPGESVYSPAAIHSEGFIPLTLLGADSGRRQRATARHPGTTKTASSSAVVCHDAAWWPHERVQVNEHVETSE